MTDNDRRKQASKRLRETYDKIPVDEKRKFKPFRFCIAGRSSGVQPHVFWGRSLQEASTFASIWAEARDLKLDAEA